MGKYIKKFDTHSDYEDFIQTEDFIRPNVSYCVDNKDVHYNSIQTLFAIEFEAGKLAFGHANEDEIFVATKDGRAQIWYADGSGNVTGYTESVDDIAGTIIDAYNEHFGTDIEIWTPETKTLQVGGTVPNWNAYEKIFITIKYKVQPAGNTNWAIGEMKDNKFYLYVAENPHLGNCGVDDEGIVTMVFLNIEMLFNQIWKPAFMAAGFEVATYETKFEYNVGDTIEDWADYIAI